MIFSGEVFPGPSRCFSLMAAFFVLASTASQEVLAVPSRSHSQSHTHTHTHSFSAAGSASAVEISSPPAVDSAYRLSQICKTVGRQDILISGRGLRVQHRNSGLVALFLPPYKEVFFFNSKSKKCISMPLSKFVSPFAYSWNMLFNVNIADIPVVKTGRREFAVRGSGAISAVQYQSTVAFVAAQKALRAQKEIPARSVQSITYIVTDRFAAAAPQARLLQKMYGLPAVPGVPLDMVFHDLHDTKKSYLTTSEVQETKASAADFARPAGFSTASTVEEVTSVVNDGIDAF
jgi:hypothetical protein